MAQQSSEGQKRQRNMALIQSLDNQMQQVLGVSLARFLPDRRFSKDILYGCCTRNCVTCKCSVHKVTFPNAQTKMFGRFLKTCLRESRTLDVCTQRVLFSFHRWEFMAWITSLFEPGEAVLCERLILWHPPPPHHLKLGETNGFCSIFWPWVSRTRLSDLCPTSDLRWGSGTEAHNMWHKRESHTTLMQALKGDPLWSRQTRPWLYLWARDGIFAAYFANDHLKQLMVGKDVTG